MPVRCVSPTSLAAVSSGRKEGHVKGTRIVSIDFVGARHTAIVSADELGLAFYHSLGKVLFVEATDTLRILGRYPHLVDTSAANEDSSSTIASRKSSLNGNLKVKRGNTLLGMSSLPLGVSPHAIEKYNLIALLTPLKLVVVGLKPSPRTWFRRHREVIGPDLYGLPSPTGCIVWYPSVDSSRTTAEIADSSPLLAYSWGRYMYVLRVYESRIQQKAVNPKVSGRVSTVEVGKVDFTEISRWSTDAEYLAVQWLNSDVTIIFCFLWISSFLLIFDSAIIRADLYQFGGLECPPGHLRRDCFI